MLPQVLSPVVGWAMAQHFNSLEIEERGVIFWTFIRTWEKYSFRRFAVTVSDRLSRDTTHELSLLGSVVGALGG